MAFRRVTSAVRISPIRRTRSKFMQISQDQNAYLCRTHLVMFVSPYLWYGRVRSGDRPGVMTVVARGYRRRSSLAFMPMVRSL